MCLCWEKGERRACDEACMMWISVHHPAIATTSNWVTVSNGGENLCVLSRLGPHLLPTKHSKHADGRVFVTYCDSCDLLRHSATDKRSLAHGSCICCRIHKNPLYVPQLLRRVGRCTSTCTIRPLVPRRVRIHGPTWGHRALESTPDITASGPWFFRLAVLG